MNRPTYWLDQLDGWSVLHLLLRPRGRVRYLRAGLRRWASLLGRMGFEVDPEPEDYSIADLTMADGENAYHAGDRLADEVGRSLGKEADGQSEDYRRYLEQSAAWDPGRRLGFDLCTLACLARGCPQSVLVVAGGSALGEFRPRLNWGGPLQSRWTPADLLAALREAAGALAMISGAIRELAERRARSAPCVLVQAVNGADLGSHSDFFWLPDSGLDPGCVLYYFNRPDRQPTPLLLSQLARLGVTRLVHWSNWRVGDDWAYLLASCRHGALCLLGVLLALAGRMPLGWLGLRLQARQRRWLVSWEAFLRRHRVKIHIHVTSDTRGAAMAQAARQAGALDVVYQWSANHFDVRAQRRIMESDVYFCWGSMFAEQVRLAGFRPRTVLIGGHIYRHLAQPARRQQLELSSCTHIVGAFDNSFHSTCYYSPRVTLDFLETVAEAAWQSPRTGLVLKSKGQMPHEWMLQKVPSLAKLAQSGRLVVLPESARPMQAAAGCDLVVGLFCNTAVVEGALAGARALFYDGARASYGTPEMRELFKGAVVDHDGLVEAVKGNARESGRQDISALDPFPDSGGCSRLGHYIAWAFQELVQGRPRQDALLAANQRYRDEYGQAWVLEDL